MHQVIQRVHFEQKLIERLWPNHIDRSYSYSSVCKFSNRLFTEKCSAGGSSTIQTWAHTQGPSDINNSWNITVPITLSNSAYMPLVGSLNIIYSWFVEGTESLYNLTNTTNPFGTTPLSNPSNLTRTWYMSQTSSVLAADALLNVAEIAGSENATTRLQALLNGRSPPAPQAFAACSTSHYNVRIEKAGGYNDLASFRQPFLKKTRAMINTGMQNRDRLLNRGNILVAGL